MCNIAIPDGFGKQKISTKLKAFAEQILEVVSSPNLQPQHISFLSIPAADDTFVEDVAVSAKRGGKRHGPAVNQTVAARALGWRHARLTPMRGQPFSSSPRRRCCSSLTFTCAVGRRYVSKVHARPRRTQSIYPHRAASRLHSPSGTEATPPLNYCSWRI